MKAHAPTAESLGWSEKSECRFTHAALVLGSVSQAA